MRLLFLLLLILFQFGKLLRIPVLDSGPKSAPLTPEDIVIAMLLCGYLIRSLTLGRMPFARVPGIAYFMVFSWWAVVSLLASTARFDLTSGQAFFSFLYLLRWCLYASLYFLTYEIISTSELVRSTVKRLFLCGGAFCVFGLVQVVFLPNFAFIVYPDARPYIDFDVHQHRLVSTILDPNISAIYISIFALIAFSFYLKRVERWAVPFLIFAISVVVTLSRGGNLGLLCGLLFLMARSSFSRKRVVLALVAGAIMLLSVYPLLVDEIEHSQRFSVTDMSAMSRVQEWEVSVRIIADNLLVGIGFNTLGFVLPRYGFWREGGAAFGLSGDILVICMLTGVVGLGIYGMLWAKMASAGWRLQRDSKDVWDRAFGEGLLASMVAVSVSSMFAAGVLYPQIMALLWILWGLTERLLALVAGSAPSPSMRLSRSGGIAAIRSGGKLGGVQISSLAERMWIAPRWPR
jgi:hypothetical protein